VPNPGPGMCRIPGQTTNDALCQSWGVGNRVLLQLELVLKQQATSRAEMDLDNAETVVLK
jgi:hypothetical protein